MTSVLRHTVQWTVVVCLGYVLAVYGAFLAMIVVSALEQRIQRRRRHVESFVHVRDSEITIPVSIVAAVYNEAAMIAAATRSFLGVDYPEFEVIVVNDGSTDDTLSVLTQEFDLEPLVHFFRKRFETAPLRGLYRSRSHPGLIVVDKDNGGKADALNAGINLARYRYLCGVDGDTVLTRDSLLRGMRLALSDPQRVVGVTGHVAINSAPEAAIGAGGEPSHLDRRMLLAFQHLDYLRSFFNNRLGWTRLNTMLCAVGAFQIWRRDVLEELGGFSTTFTCEDIELTFRVHEHYRRARQPYEIVSLADTVGVTEGPDRVRKLVSQRERWQRVIVETVVHYRGMLFRPRYGPVGLIGVPYFILSEVLAPLFEMLAVLAVLAGLALRTVALEQALLMLALLALLNGLITSAAVLLEDNTSRAYPVRDLLRLMTLGLLDLFCYRPLIVWARVKGTWRYLRRDKSWHKFDRNTRTAPQT